MLQLVSRDDAVSCFMKELFLKVPLNHKRTVMSGLGNMTTEKGRSDCSTRLVFCCKMTAISVIMTNHVCHLIYFNPWKRCHGADR